MTVLEDREYHALLTRCRDAERGVRRLQRRARRAASIVRSIECYCDMTYPSACAPCAAVAALAGQKASPQ